MSEILIMNLFLAGSGLVLACLGVCYKSKCKKISKKIKQAQLQSRPLNRIQFYTLEFSLLVVLYFIFKIK